jgi:MoaA/NifB/PqqE/SkfB family radical SAM enzyme
MQIESIGADRPEVFENLLLGQAACDKGHLKVAAFPQFLGLESTTKCNIDCIQCGLKSHPLKNRDIPGEVLRLLEEGGYLDRAASLLFSDYGETLMGSRFDALLELVGRHRLPVSSFFTNGTLLTEQMARRIVEAQVKLIIVSVDAATKETYERIRRKSDFDLVVHNIELLQRIKKERGAVHPRLHFNCVGMKSNVQELPELVRLAHRLGVEAVVYSNLVPYSYELSQEALARVPELAAQKKREARAVGRQLGVRLGLAESHLPIAQDVPAPVCQAPDLGEEFFTGSLQVHGVPQAADMGEFLNVQAQLQNHSRHAWLSTHSAQAHPVNVGYHWLDERGERVGGEHRELLEHDLGPGQSAELELCVRVPDQSGCLTLCLDLVREGIRWFGWTLRFPVEVRDAFRVANYPLSFERCEFPWKSMHIKVNGDVYPCCFLSKPMGNLLESGIDGVWNGPAYQRLRRSVAMGTYEVCKGAHCKFVTNDPVPAFLAEIRCRRPPRLFLPAETQTFEVEVTNRSRVTWQAHGDEVDSVVHLSYHWFKQDGDPRIFDGLRSPLPHDVEPGQTVRVPLTAIAPRRPGRLTLCVDLVMEHVSWFANAGNPPLNLPMTVVERPRSARAKMRHWLERKGLVPVSAPD